MDKFALIGYPIAHSLSPRLFKAAYHSRYAYELVETQSFDEAWQVFLSDYKAINVTAPFKIAACQRADILAPECQRIGATNLCVKTIDGIKAYNSDYLGVRYLLKKYHSKGSIAIIGYGGAGRAAMAAAEDFASEVKLFHHNEISNGVEADTIIYTLPKWVDGADKLHSTNLIEANYKDPCLLGHAGYIPGTEWHLQQAIAGYSLMTGEEANAKDMISVYSV